MGLKVNDEKWDYILGKNILYKQKLEDLFKIGFWRSTNSQCLGIFVKHLPTNQKPDSLMLVILVFFCFIK